MRSILFISFFLACFFLISLLAMRAIDKITVRDCERGIKAACEEVDRLKLDK